MLVLCARLLERLARLEAGLEYSLELPKLTAFGTGAVADNIK
jgi:hypothetical protein